MGAMAAALRGVDALIDPMFRKLVAPIPEEDKRQITQEAAEKKKVVSDTEVVKTDP
jgi:hypothetical protein